MVGIGWVGLVLGGCAHEGTPVAAAEPAPAMPLAGDLASMSFYVGDWSCKGTTFATADSPEDHWEAAIHVRPDVPGWLSVHMVGPGDNLTTELKGYDAEKGRWFHLWAHDGGWGSYSSPGWEGDHMVSTDDDPATGGDHHRTVFTRLGDTRYSHAEQVDDGAGFHTVWEKICDKVP